MLNQSNEPSLAFTSRLQLGMSFLLRLQLKAGQSFKLILPPSFTPRTTSKLYFPITSSGVKPKPIDPRSRPLANCDLGRAVQKTY